MDIFAGPAFSHIFISRVTGRTYSYCSTHRVVDVPGLYFESSPPLNSFSFSCPRLSPVSGRLGRVSSESGLRGWQSLGPTIRFSNGYLLIEMDVHNVFSLSPTPCFPSTFSQNISFGHFLNRLSSGQHVDVPNYFYFSQQLLVCL